MPGQHQVSGAAELLVVALAFGVVHAQVSPTTAVDVVVDSGTVECVFDDGTVERLRLIGMHSPEVVAPRRSRSSARVARHPSTRTRC